MEEETRNDWKRVTALVVVLLGIAFLAIFAFNQGSDNMLTGATTVVSESLFAQSWVLPVAILAVLVVGVLILFKLNH